MAAPTWTHAKDARVAPCCPRRKDARVWAVTELRPSLRCLRSSSHVLPHDQEQREGGGGLAIKEASPSPIEARPFFPKANSIPSSPSPLRSIFTAFAVCETVPWVPVL